MFLTSYVHLQEDYTRTVHASLYGMFSMRLCNLSTILEDCLHKRMGNIPYKATCTVRV